MCTNDSGGTPSTLWTAGCHHTLPQHIFTCMDTFMHSSNLCLETFLIALFPLSATCQNNCLIRLSCLALWKGLLCSVVPAIKLIVWPTSKETDFCTRESQIKSTLAKQVKKSVCVWNFESSTSFIIIFRVLKYKLGRTAAAREPEL